MDTKKLTATRASTEDTPTLLLSIVTDNQFQALVLLTRFGVAERPYDGTLFIQAAKYQDRPHLEEEALRDTEEHYSHDHTQIGDNYTPSLVAMALLASATK